jgi:hypothetical protein
MRPRPYRGVTVGGWAFGARPGRAGFQWREIRNLEPHALVRTSAQRRRAHACTTSTLSRLESESASARRRPAGFARVTTGARKEGASPRPWAPLGRSRRASKRAKLAKSAGKSPNRTSRGGLDPPLGSRPRRIVGLQRTLLYSSISTKCRTGNIGILGERCRRAKGNRTARASCFDFAA